MNASRRTLFAPSWCREVSVKERICLVQAATGFLFSTSYPIGVVHIDNQVYFMEVLGLKGYIEERAVEVANYLLNHNATVRQTAKKFGISKSTVHMEVTI